MPDSSAPLRKFMMESFSDDELEDLCFDYFRDIAQQFTQGMNKGQKVRHIIGHLARRDRLSELHAALERERSDQYRQEFGAWQSLQVSQVRVSPTPASVVRNPRQVFLSHAQQNADFARRLAADLEAKGWTVWIAPDSILPGEKWVEAIERGLEESSVFVLVITPAAVASRWVNSETTLAIGLEHDGVMEIIPLLREATRMPLWWRNYQYIPFQVEYDSGLGQLLERLGDSTDSGPGKPGNKRSEFVIPPQPESAAAKSARIAAASLIHLASADPAVRAEAALTLGRLGSAGAATVAALLRAYGEDTADAPRHAALKALLALGRAADVGMVHVPAGEFLMGSTNQDKEAAGDEKPQHRLYLPAYYMDRTPVTNEQFGRFIAAGGYANPTYWAEAIQAGRWKEGKYVDYNGKPHDQPRLWNDQKWNGNEQPVVGVSWYEALAYARWAGKRLPTEAEWEKAARGDDGRLYPWGNEWDPKRLNSKEAGPGKTTPVGRYSPDGDSSYKAADMAGNVWEWCSTCWWDDKREEYKYPYSPDDGREDLSGGDNIVRVLRGGSWANEKKYARCAARYRDYPRFGDDDWGLRCCCAPSSLLSGSEF